jgi:multiple sugar transport system substrate-binding protein
VDSGLRKGASPPDDGRWLLGHLKNWLAPDSRGLWRSALLPGGQARRTAARSTPSRAGRAQGGGLGIHPLHDHDGATQLESLRVLDSFPALSRRSRTR